MRTILFEQLFDLNLSWGSISMWCNCWTKIDKS